MSAVNLVGLILAVLLAAFLVAALLFPERSDEHHRWRASSSSSRWSSPLVAVHRPLGDYMYRVVVRHEALARRARHLPAGRRQPGRRAALGASTPAACWRSPPSRILFLYAFQRVQDHLLAVARLRPA